VARFDTPPEPYPDDEGVTARMLDGPVDPPAAARAEPVATDRHGNERKVYAGLPGMRPRGTRSPLDDGAAGWHDVLRSRGRRI
jgi:hypothetical protein